MLFVVCVGVPASLALSVEGSSRWRGRRGTGNMSLSQRRHTHLHLSTQIDLTSVVHCIHCGHPHLQPFFPSGAVIKFQGCGPNASVMQIKVCCALLF